ncbi:MAG: TonB-dependent receptor, partial [Chitinophagaceae bacterium]
MAQTGRLTGTVMANGKPLLSANVVLRGEGKGAVTDSLGQFSIEAITAGTFKLTASAVGFVMQEKNVAIIAGETTQIDFALEAEVKTLGEVVVSGSLKEVSRLESPVPVEVYSKSFFKANPTPSVFEALQNVNGVRPQLNCNVCNTGDIHINGLEGPYTMVLIDGMPIVSGLSTVYGLTGIPQSLIERIEIVKGPASTLYGSEAVGGIINIMTQKPAGKNYVMADVFATHWGEVNTDIGLNWNAGKKAKSLLGINYFNYQNPIDNNKDGFTDVALQNRISIFNKWLFSRGQNRVFSLAGRYVYEDRWGGQKAWTKQHRGGDSIYGESIYIKRWELLGTYQLPFKENVMLQLSANGHQQNSVYGITFYEAAQNIAFAQLTWDKTIGKNDLLAGAAYRYNYYDDNTPATATFDTVHAPVNIPSITHLPGLFLQNEITINSQNKLLLGLRYDYNNLHGSIVSPRINYKLSSKDNNNVLRLSAGNGFRVAHVFTEDHAALTGTRQVVFNNDLKPESSWNGNVNFVKKFFGKEGTFITLDATAFYTYFTNRIIADYETDVSKIIYDNLDGYAVSKGVSLNADIVFRNGLKVLAGGTLMDVYFEDNGVKQQQLLTERFSAVWNVGYTFKNAGITIDYTGNVYGPMRLPLLGELDDRPAESPVWSVQNIQLTKKLAKGFEVYGGVKNLLNYTPPANSIARAF